MYDLSKNASDERHVSLLNDLHFVSKTDDEGWRALKCRCFVIDESVPYELAVSCRCLF